MKNRIKIKVYVNSIKFNNFLIYNNIKYDNLIKDKDSFTLDIDFKDLDKFSRYKISIIKYYGIKSIINCIIYNKYVFIGLLSSLIILYLLCNTIFDIKVNTDNKELMNKILVSLKENEIFKYKKKKSFEELLVIKNKILEDNKDSLEWIEIIEDGCNYIVEITERIVGKEDIINDSPSHIVASKDGLITYVSIRNGVLLKEKNDYVKKGDIIISGEIYKGDKLINKVNAKGIVYAEVWYTVRVSIPFEYTEYIATGKTINRYYISVGGKEFTLIGKYNAQNVMKNKKLIIDKPYLFFDVYKEEIKKYEYKKFKVDEKEAYKEAILRADANINKKLDSDEYIMFKKVLKKEVFSSKMVLEVFYKVYENITDTSRIKEVINDK